MFAVPIVTALRVPPVEAGEVVQVLAHVPRSDGGGGERIPRTLRRHDRGGAYVFSSAPGFGYGATNTRIGFSARLVLRLTGLSLADESGYTVGCRVDAESVSLGITDPGVQVCIVQPMATVVVGYAKGL